MTPFDSIVPGPPQAVTERDFLTLDQLEAIAFEHAADGVSILAAGDEWRLQIRDKGVQRTYRARRDQGASA